MRPLSIKFATVDQAILHPLFARKEWSSRDDANRAFSLAGESAIGGMLAVFASGAVRVYTE